MQFTKIHAIIIAAIAIVAIAAAAVLLMNNGGNGGGEKEDVNVDAYSSNPVLWIRGNCDGDKDIDADDVRVINAVVKARGSASAYPWCDANNDGKVDSKDADAVQSMINGTAKTLYFKDIDGDVEKFTVRDGVNVVAVNKCQAEDVLMVINKDPKSKIVGGDQQVYKYNNEVALNFGTDASKGQVLVTGTSNGEVQAEVVSTLVKAYGHVEICLGSAGSYGKNLENDFGSNPDVSIVRLPSWEDGTLSGVMTYGYLFGGVQKSSCWDQALRYYDWYMGYYEPIVKEVSKIPASDRPKVLTVYVKDCYPGATNKVLSKTSGDFERSVECGGNNVGEYFGNGYVAFTAEDMAACQKVKGLDKIIVEPSGIYGEGGEQAVIDAVQLGINELKGYVSDSTEIYSLSFMVTAGPGCPVSFVFFAKTFFPDNAAFKDFDTDKAFKEYLDLIGWGDRTDVSKICSYGPGYPTA